MSDATVSVEVGALSSVVKEDWLVDVPENATEGTPSFAASHAAPLEPWVSFHALQRRRGNNSYTVPEIKTVIPRLATEYMSVCNTGCTQGTIKKTYFRRLDQQQQNRADRRKTQGSMFGCHIGRRQH